MPQQCSKPIFDVSKSRHKWYLTIKDWLQSPILLLQHKLDGRLIQCMCWSNGECGHWATHSEQTVKHNTCQLETQNECVSEPVDDRRSSQSWYHLEVQNQMNSWRHHDTVQHDCTWLQSASDSVLCVTTIYQHNKLIIHSQPTCAFNTSVSTTIHYTVMYSAVALKCLLCTT